MIIINELGMTLGNKLLFSDVHLNLNTNQSYALIGANGSGKSTLFKLITGEEEATFGEVMIPKDATIGWLKQDQFRYENTPIDEVVLQGKQALYEALKEKDVLLDDGEWSDKKGFRIAALEDIIAHYDGYQAPLEIESILIGLGIPKPYHQKPLKALSGGYKLRVLLAQVLFQNPSILLLDEPTNHLDIVSIRWLEQFLKNTFKGLLLFISHDMTFIDNLADYILDIDYAEIRKYSGTYTKFLAEKQLIQEQKAIEKRSAEEKIAHLQQFVDRFGAKASKASLARSRMKMIDKIEVPDLVHSSRIAPHFQFNPKRPSGKIVCKLKDISKTYQQKPLFNGFNAEVHRHDKIALLGENGRGKSTLIKIILNLVSQDQGTIDFGSEVRTSYFSQDHHDVLNHSASVLNWLREEVVDVTEQGIRNVLGQMLFSKDTVDKNILSLSGGEAARLLLAKVILASPNLLLLDEPTNHLDLETIDALANALAAYTGTLIFVSHNRHFVEKIATRIWSFQESGKIKDFKGRYHDFAT